MRRADFPGPLAGVLIGLERCETPYLVTVPCDTPNFPLDLVERLAAALEAEGAELAMAATRESGNVVRQPVFCLLKAELLESLVKYLQSGRAQDRPLDRDASHLPQWCSTTRRRSTTPTRSKSCSACSAEEAQSRRMRTSMRCSHFTCRGPVRVSAGAWIANGPSLAPSGAPSRS